MANTYRKVYLHLVFAVKNREALLDKDWRESVFSYISGIVKKKGHYPLSVNGYNDHVHILIDYSLKELVPDLVREIKKSSSKYIKDSNFSPFHFEWQTGYGVFSFGWKELSKMIDYVKGQEEHHRNRSFKDEYYSLLNKYEIEFKDEYVFQFINDEV